MFWLDSPVVGTGSAQFDGAVTVLWYEPVQVGVRDQAHVLPVLLGQVAAVGVEVPEEHHVLPSHTETIPVRRVGFKDQAD